jgi:hypothetical protein
MRAWPREGSTIAAVSDIPYRLSAEFTEFLPIKIARSFTVRYGFDQPQWITTFVQLDGWVKAIAATSRPPFSSRLMVPVSTGPAQFVPRVRLSTIASNTRSPNTSTTVFGAVVPSAKGDALLSAVALHFALRTRCVKDGN